jgi:23S rRNA pseudouridine1911/1915/1917 synthase
MTVSSDRKSRLPILLDSGPMVVVDKPGGLLTQAPPDIDSVEAWLREQFAAEQPASDRRPYVGVPHRLDRPASGAMVMLRHAKAARRVAEQFEHRTVEKTYWALVSGRVSESGESSGQWSDYMRKVPDEARSEIVGSDHPEAQYALLDFQILEQCEDASWLEIRLETGRTHQIRLQCGSRGFPLLGDQQYGSSMPFGPQVDDPRSRWIALHARRLSLDHPAERRRVTLEAPLFSCWEPWIARFPGMARRLADEARLS